MLGYEDIHTWRVLREHPFYFFVKDGKTWISLDGQGLSISYDYVYHGGCCAIGTTTNPSVSNDTIWFYAVRDGAWYSVELRVTD